MKKMKKTFIIFFVLSLSFLLSACSYKDKILKIEIKDYPNKTIYELNEELDLSGGTILILYKKNKIEEISMTDSKVMYSGYNKLISGKQEIILSYNKKTTKLNVIINELSVVAILIKTYPIKKEYFVHETLDLSGGTFYISKSDGTKSELSMSSSLVTISCDMSIPEEEKRVTLTYCGHKTILIIKVSEIIIDK